MVLTCVSSDGCDIELVGAQSVNLVWLLNHSNSKITNLDFVWELIFYCQSQTTTYEYYGCSEGQKPLYNVTNNASPINEMTGKIFLTEISDIELCANLCVENDAKLIVFHT